MPPCSRADSRQPLFRTSQEANGDTSHADRATARVRRAGSPAIAEEATLHGPPHSGSATPTQPVLRAGWHRHPLRELIRTTEVTSSVQNRIGLLRDSLEEQFQRSTDQLAELTVRSRQRGRGDDHDTLPRSSRRPAGSVRHRSGVGSHDRGQLRHLQTLHGRHCAATTGDPAARPVLRSLSAQTDRLTLPAPTTSATARRCTRQGIGTPPGGLHAFLVDPTSP